MNLGRLRDNAIRELKPSDILWIYPIARQYGEWEAVKELIDNPEYHGVIIMFVIAPYAVCGIYSDEHGYVGAGLCDREGIRHLIRLSKKVMRTIEELKLTIHAHPKSGSWQERLFSKLGFAPSEDGMIYYPVGNYEV